MRGKVIMRYILASNVLSNLDTIRTKYEAERKINIDTRASIVGLPAFFGGTNVKARREQIYFLEKIKAILQPNLLKAEDIRTPAQWYVNLTALRVMIAACIFVQTQIGRSKNNSALYRLIDSSLGITETNYLDIDDINQCYFAANRVINSSGKALDEANGALRIASFQPITEKEWYEFSMFLSNYCESQMTVPQTAYPITSVTQPLFGMAFLHAGTTLGYLGGELLSQSTKALAAKNRLTDFIEYTMPGASAGATFLAPICASKLLTTYCSFNFAHIMGVSMGLLGQGVGLGVGLTLDLSYSLMCQACVLIKKYHEGKMPEITGTRLADGACVLDGIVMELKDEEKLYEESKLKSIELHADEGDFVQIEVIDEPVVQPVVSASASLRLQ